jgi:hypothetical protein
MTPDPWQVDCIHEMLAVRPDGKWVCFECGVIVARQSGKGVILEIRALSGLFLLGERLIMWSAHEYKTAKEGYRRTLAWIEGSDEHRRQVKRVNNTHGEEGIELWGEGRFRRTRIRRLFFLARSKGSGRGFTGDCNLIDESYAYTPDQQAALMPTMSAVPNPQVVYTSSPPLDAATGEPMYELRERALAPFEDVDPGVGVVHAGGRRLARPELIDPSLMWCDWGADIDLDDPRDAQKVRDRLVWYATNPGIPYGRPTEEHIARELRGMGLRGFGRERLCVWPKRAGDGVIDLKQWARLADECAGEECDLDEYDDGPVECRHTLGPDVALCLDVTPSRDYGSIGLVGRRADALEHWELIDYRPGTDWMVARVVELILEHRPVGVGLDVAGPAGSLLKPLNDAACCLACGWSGMDEPDPAGAAARHADDTGHRTGVHPPEDPEEPQRGELLIPTAREVAAATGDMLDAVRQSRGRHIDQDELNTAVRGAKLRPLGDASALGRRLAAVDISPLVTITGARYVFAVRAPLVQDDDDGEAGAWLV